MWYLNLFVGLLLMGCKSQQKEPSMSYSNTQIPFEVLLTDSHSNHEAQSYEVIRSAQRLQEVFAKINRTRKPGIPVPEVDFSKTLVLFLNMGQQNSGGYSVSVASIEKKEAALVVFVEEKKPAPTDKVITVLTTPFTLVAMEHTDLPVEFTEVNQ